MALTKVTRSGITDNSVNAAKIEDGTIVEADITPGTLTATKLAGTLDLSSKTVTLPNTSVTNAMLAGSIANAKLANSTITINGAATALGGSVSAGSIAWQSVITSNTTMVAGRGYFVNTTSGAITMTLPSGGTAGDTIAIKDYAGTFATNNLTIGRNSHNIQGVANDSAVSTNRASIVLVYIDATKGWLYTNESNVSSLGKPLFTTATGGTVTTSGDFKIHTFTGDGNFVVSQLGNKPANPSGGPNNVDYRVVAGGGNGGTAYYSGGGGAGGHRTTFPSPTCNAGAFPISQTTYPITVGSGGAGVTTPDSGAASDINPGSNSIFSTITSAGGGGGTPLNVQNPADNGGSGGGGGGYSLSGGAGNTPPVSPPQGNPGGNGDLTPGGGAGGGGGGAGGGGTNGTRNPSATAGNGGAGSANSITGSSVTLAGGGGAGGFCGGSSNIPGGTGGSGGGGPGHPKTGVSGTANTGGGGGAVGGRSPGTPPFTGGSGGKGIVIIRYKFQ